MIEILLSNVWSVTLIVLLFGGSIFIHEWGHFLAARKRGLIVERFSIGFGPKLLSWTRNGVEYRIAAIPFGGYVALPQLADLSGIEGQYETKGEALRPVSYTDKLIVAVMGAVFNILFAFFLACLLWAFGQPTSEEAQTTVIGYVQETLQIDENTEVPSPAHLAGLRPGDRVLKIDRKKVSVFSELTHTLITGSGRDQEGRPRALFTIEREGRIIEVEVFPRLTRINPVSGERFRLVGISPAHSLIIKGVEDSSPARRAGLRDGDTILSVDGEKLYSLASLIDHLGEKDSNPITLLFRRGSEEIEAELTAQQVAYTKPLGRLEVEDGSREAELKVQPIYPPDSVAVPTDPSTHSTLTVHEVRDPTGFVFGQLRAGDTVEMVNGKAVDSLESWVALIEGQPEGTLNIATRSGDRIETFPILGKAATSLVPPRERPMIGANFRSKRMITRVDPIEQFENIIVTTLQVLGSLFDRDSDVSIRNLSGPPGIIRVINELSKIDIRHVIWFVCLLNINLAIINLLPIPVLDGGHIAFATLAKLRGKALPPNLVAATQGIFMILLFSLMIYVSFFDVRRWQGDHETEKRHRLQSTLYIEPDFRNKPPDDG